MTAPTVGDRFGKLVVIETDLPEREHVSKCLRTVVLVLCDCGTKKRVSVHKLRYGNTISCGCNKHRIHHKEWGAWVFDK